MLKIIFTVISLFFYAESFASDNSIIAIVDNNAITKKELEERKKIENYFIKQQNPNLIIDNKSILKQLINEYVINNKASKFGMKVFDVEIDAYINKLEESNKMHKGKLREILQKNNLSLSSFRAKIGNAVLLNKLTGDLWRSQYKSSEKDVYSLIMDSNNKQNVIVKFKVYSTKDLTNSSFSKLVTLKNKLKDCNYTKIPVKSINVEEHEANLSFMDTGTRVLLSDLEENLPSNIIKSDDSYKSYLICEKFFPKMDENQMNNIKNYMDVENLKVKTAQIIEQWVESSSIKIFDKNL